MLTTYRVVFVFMSFEIFLSQLSHTNVMCTAACFIFAFAKMLTKYHMSFCIENDHVLFVYCRDMKVSLCYVVTHIFMLWVHRNKVHGSLCPCGCCSFETYTMLGLCNQ
jgi:hypothetical protein